MYRNKHQYSNVDLPLKLMKSLFNRNPHFYIDVGNFSGISVF